MREGQILLVCPCVMLREKEREREIPGRVTERVSERTRTESIMFSLNNIV